MGYVFKSGGGKGKIGKGRKKGKEYKREKETKNVKIE